MKWLKYSNINCGVKLRGQPCLQMSCTSLAYIPWSKRPPTPLRPLCSVVSAPDIPRRTPASNLLRHLDAILQDHHMPLFRNLVDWWMDEIEALVTWSPGNIRSQFINLMRNTREAKMDYSSAVCAHTRASIQLTHICENGRFISEIAHFLVSSHSTTT